MENLGLRDDPEKEGWEKMGPLADPTPANAKNRGAAGRKQRRRDENGRGNEEATEQRTPASLRAKGSGDDAEEAARSEMEGIRIAVAEAIHELERETMHHKIRGEGGGGREGTAKERRTEGKGERMGQMEQQQQLHPG